ncbi:MAG: insulinase family protein [Leptospiraceae bacterium]|nr:insulinase family protein [Leptospiraceae bacterium]MCP5499841.1 insulinase family protein [Leptospiraceae bacterium]
MYKNALIFLLGLLLPIGILYPKDLFEEISGRLQKTVKKVSLQNGLTLIMMKRTASPTLALYIKFKAGSVDETPEMAGTAHLLEHMMFKGTKNIGTLDYEKEERYLQLIQQYGQKLDILRLKAREYTQIGEEVPDEIEKEIQNHEKSLKVYQMIQNKYIIKSEDNLIYTQNGQVHFNAYTTHDVTNYQIELPANRLELWARIESDRLRNPILREYYTERDVIMEERRMRVENQGFGVLREKYLSVAFDRHPYRMPVIGYPSNIPFLDIAETENFFKEHYSPDNMVISIVGDLNFEETERIVRKYFSSLQPSGKTTQMRIKEIESMGEKRFTVKFPSSPIMLMGWHKPAFPHPDNNAFDILNMILTGGTDSRLFKRIILNDKSALSVNAWNGDPGERYSNLFTIMIRPNTDTDTETLEKSIWEEIEKIQKGEVSDEEIEKVKNKLIADFFRGIDNNGTLADVLSYYEIITGDWANLFKSYSILNKVKKEDLQRVSRKYLTRDNVTVGKLIDSRKDKEEKEKK